MMIGTGTTVTFNSIALAEILDVTPPGMSRESVQSSHMGTVTAHTHLPTKLYDGGELTLEIAFDPKLVMPFADTVAACVILFPDSAASTWTFDAFVTGYEPADPLEDRMTATITLKVTGVITVA
jgi:hypothetical protein